MLKNIIKYICVLHNAANKCLCIVIYDTRPESERISCKEIGYGQLLNNNFKVFVLDK